MLNHVSSEEKNKIQDAEKSVTAMNESVADPDIPFEMRLNTKATVGSFGGKINI